MVLSALCTYRYGILFLYTWGVPSPSRYIFCVPPHFLALFTRIVQSQKRQGPFTFYTCQRPFASLGATKHNNPVSQLDPYAAPPLPCPPRRRYFFCHPPLPSTLAINHPKHGRGPRRPPLGLICSVPHGMYRTARTSDMGFSFPSSRRGHCSDCWVGTPPTHHMALFVREKRPNCPMVITMANRALHRERTVVSRAISDIDILIPSSCRVHGSDCQEGTPPTPSFGTVCVRDTVCLFQLGLCVSNTHLPQNLVLVIVIIDK